MLPDWEGEGSVDNPPEEYSEEIGEDQEMVSTKVYYKEK